MVGLVGVTPSTAERAGGMGGHPQENFQKSNAISCNLMHSEILLITFPMGNFLGTYEMCFNPLLFHNANFGHIYMTEIL